MKSEWKNVEAVQLVSGNLPAGERARSVEYVKERMRCDVGRKVFGEMAATGSWNVMVFATEEEEQERAYYPGGPDRDLRLRLRADVVPMDELLPIVMGLIQGGIRTEERFGGCMHQAVLFFRPMVLKHLRSKKEELTDLERMVWRALTTSVGPVEEREDGAGG